MRTGTLTLISGLGLILAGCTVPLEGGGRIRIGFHNSNYFEVSHAADANKAGNKSKVQLSIDQTVLDALLPSADPKPESEGSVPVPPIE